MKSSHFPYAAIILIVILAVFAVGTLRAFTPVHAAAGADVRDEPLAAPTEIASLAPIQATFTPLPVDLLLTPTSDATAQLPTPEPTATATALPTPTLRSADTTGVIGLAIVIVIIIIGGSAGSLLSFARKKPTGK